jgi:tRNA/rRNA methyltransferase
MSTKVNLDNIAIILHEPHFPENIGAAARAAKNMGIRRLIVVNPKDCDLTRVLRMATHNAEDVVSDMEIYDNVRDALAPFGYVVGTTARRGSHRQEIRVPGKLAQELVSISKENQVAILFGTEKSGLSNDELRDCDALGTIPTGGFSSVNLAQAVMIMAYEIYMATIDEPKTFVPRLANREELEGMYDHLRETLVKINFINPQNPEYWMGNVRRFFTHVGLRARDVKIIRGVCRQINWYCEQQRFNALSAPCGNENHLAEEKHE